MLFMEEIPPRVSIQEAVRLAEQYGGDESPRFVNGVLDALYRRLGATG
jgi:N utilization substance protein B